MVIIHILGGINKTFFHIQGMEYTAPKLSGGGKMEVKEFLLKTLERAEAYLDESINDLTTEEMRRRPGPQANPIGFILWYLTRGEDRFVNTTMQQKPQVWECLVTAAGLQPRNLSPQVLTNRSIADSLDNELL